MRINFRQGIIRHPLHNNNQSFLVIQNNHVSLLADSGIIEYTIANGDKDYTFTENVSVDLAWGPLDLTKEYWIYWDINPITLQRTFGYTELEPYTGTGNYTGQHSIVFAETTTESSTTGFTNNLYDLKISIDGNSYIFTFDGSKSITVGDFVQELQKQVVAYAIVEFVDNTLTIKSKTTTTISSVVMDATTLATLSIIPGFDYVKDPIVIADIPPTHDNQHWFNSAANKMFVYQMNQWTECLRVFAAHIDTLTIYPMGQGHLIISEDNRPILLQPSLYTGSQVGLNNIAATTGRILIDSEGHPIKSDNFEFYHSDDILTANYVEVNQPSIYSNTIFSTGIARENVSKYHVVKLVDADRIDVASYNDIENTALFLCLEDITKQNIGSVAVSGVFHNNDWNFSKSGIPLWINDTGILVEYDSFFKDLQTYNKRKRPIAWTLSNNTILFDQTMSGHFETTESSLEVATADRIGIAQLSVAAVDPSNPIAVGDNDPRLQPYQHPATHSSDIITTRPYKFLTNLLLTDQLKQLVDRELNSLLDVNIQNVQLANILVYHGSEWINQPVDLNIKRYLNDLIDVIIDNPISSQILVYDGIKWANHTVDLSGFTHIYELHDVEIQNPKAGHFLKFNGEKWTNANVTPSVGSTTLSGLSDVSLSTLKPNQALVYNGTNWVNSDYVNVRVLNDFQDVTINSPQNQQTLTYNSSSKQWTNITRPTVSVLSDLQDVAIGIQNTDDLLLYNGTQWTNLGWADFIDIVLKTAVHPCGINIKGLSVLYEETGSQYTIELINSDCSRAPIVASRWTVSKGTISPSGLFTAPAINTDTDIVTITAEYAVGDRIFTDTHSVLILNVVKVDKMLIFGPDSLFDTETANYTVELHYNNLDIEEIAPSNLTWDIKVTNTTDTGSMSDNTFVPPNVILDQTATLTATTIKHKQIYEATKQVKVLDPVIVTGIEIFGVSSMVEQSTETYYVKIKYSNNTEKVGPADSWAATVANNNDANGTILQGIFTAPSIANTTTALIQAKYTENELSFEASKTVNITNIIVITGMEMLGDSSLDEKTSKQYTLRLTYDNNTFQTVTTPNWSVNIPNNTNGSGTIVQGLYTAPEVAADSLATITATHTVNGQIYTATKDVTVINTKNIIGIEILGNSIMEETASSTYTIRLVYSNNTYLDVTTNSWSVVVDNNNNINGNINNFGKYIAPELFNGDRIATITATYSVNGTTYTATKAVTVKDIKNSVGIEIGGDTSVDELTTHTYSLVLKYNDGSESPITTTNWTVVVSNNNNVNGDIVNGVFNAPSVTADRNATISADYTTLNGIKYTASLPIIVKDAPILVSITIEGDTSITEQTSKQYTIILTYDNGSTIPGAATTWSVVTVGNNNVNGTISNGLFTAPDVTSNKTATITATYTASGSTFTDTHTVSVLAVPRPIGITIVGSSTINEFATGTYTAVLNYDTGATDPITPNTWSVIVASNNGNSGTISNGVFNAPEVTTDRTATITAWYTLNGQTFSNTLPVTVKNTKNVDRLIVVTSDGITAIPEDTQKLFKAQLKYTDGSIIDVNATSWSVSLINNNNASGAINGTGIYTPPNVTATKSGTVTATYTHFDGTVYTATLSITVVFVPIIQSVEITGSTTILENTSKTYSLKVNYDVGSEYVNANSWSVIVYTNNNANGIITSDGLFLAPYVNSNKTAVITATYIKNGITYTGTFNVTVQDRQVSSILPKTYSYTTNALAIVDNEAEILSIPTASTLTGTTIGTTWSKFAQSTSTTEAAACLNYLYYTSNTVYTNATFNSTATAFGYISDFTTETYTFGVSLTSTYPDDDAMGIVIAHKVLADGTEHTLTAYRTTGGITSGTTPVYLGIAYNFKAGTPNNEKLLTSVFTGESPTTWSVVTGSRIVVVRDRDDITIYSTRYSNINSFAFTKKFNLNDWPETLKFKGPCKIGVSSFSQAAATFSNIKYSSNEAVVYNAADQSVWTTDITTNAYVKSTTDTTYTTLTNDTVYKSSLNNTLYYFTALNGLRSITNISDILPSYYTGWTNLTSVIRGQTYDLFLSVTDSVSTTMLTSTDPESLQISPNTGLSTITYKTSTNGFKLVRFTVNSSTSVASMTIELLNEAGLTVGSYMLSITS